MTMSIEEKMVYVRKALEMGASVDLNFYKIKDEKQAKKVVAELSELANLPFKQNSCGSTTWYKIKNADYSLETAVFYGDDDAGFLEEDVNLTGSEAI